MSLVWLLLVNILIVNVWLWLSKTLFSTNRTNNRMLQRKPFFVGIAGGALLFFYPKIVSYFNISSLLYTIESDITLLHVLGISLFIALFTGVLSIVFKKRSQSVRGITHLIIPLIIIAACIALITAVSPLLGSVGTLLYFVIIAFSEESIKFFGASPTKLYALLPTDIILIAIISALGFGFIENIIYAIAALGPDGISSISSLKPALNSTLTRGAVGFLMHALFTGSAAAIIVKHLSPSPKKIILRTILGILAGILFHTLYNTIVYQGRTRLIIAIVGGGYLLLTYLMVSSDSVYLDELE